VSLSGDASLLMYDEIGTAVAGAVPVVWVVFDNGGQQIVRHGMEANGRPDHGAWQPPTAFAAMAVAKGAQALRVSDERDLDAALRTALDAGGPFLLQVLVDPDVAPPLGNRTKR
jgi:acetolactate synthase-1/2/3 large subunit